MHCAQVLGHACTCAIARLLWGCVNGDRGLNKQARGAEASDHDWTNLQLSGMIADLIVLFVAEWARVCVLGPDARCLPDKRNEPVLELRCVVCFRRQAQPVVHLSSDRAESNNTIALATHVACRRADQARRGRATSRQGAWDAVCGGCLVAHLSTSCPLKPAVARQAAAMCTTGTL